MQQLLDVTLPRLCTPACLLPVHPSTKVTVERAPLSLTLSIHCTLQCRQYHIKHVLKVGSATRLFHANEPALSHLGEWLVVSHSTYFGMSDVTCWAATN